MRGGEERRDKKQRGDAIVIVMYHLAGIGGRHDRGKVGTMFARQVRLIKTKICSPAPTIRKEGFSPIHVEIYLGKAS